MTTEMLELRAENERLRSMLASAQVVRIAAEQGEKREDGKVALSIIVTAIGLSEKALLDEIKDLLGELLKVEVGEAHEIGR